MIIRLLNLFLVVVFASLFVSACDDAPSYAPPPAVKPTPAKSLVTALPAAVVEEELAYVYDPSGTRDPFKSPLGTLVEIPIDNSIPLTPLQKFDLDQLRVIGVIIGKGEPRAMVIAPDNKSFVLKKGIKVGRNNGSVVDITTDAIIVEEQYLDFTGEIKSTMQEIKLPKQGGVK